MVGRLAGLEAAHKESAMILPKLSRATCGVHSCFAYGERHDHSRLNHLGGLFPFMSSVRAMVF